MTRPRDDSSDGRQTALICLALALAVLAAYGRLWDCEFVDFDDKDYVATNTALRQGLSWGGLVWAFTTLQASIWHPLTWISYLADFQIYGTNPGGYHLTNLLLHLANSLLLFLLLRRMTKAVWPSALAAALFALHPLHVESVAWISERKDVLSTLFWMLTLWAYVRYVEELQAAGPKVRRFYIGSVVLFALGLMAKPMLITLPFVMLLLDWWPLERMLGKKQKAESRNEKSENGGGASPREPFWGLVREKIPFFILAAASCVVTFLGARQGGAVASMAKVPLGPRAANAVVSYARYIGKTFWPSDLAVFYPYRMHWPLWAIAGSTALLALVTGWVLWRMRARPYLAVGWFWFIGMLLPVIGLVQDGSFAMADRFTYLSNVGLFIMVIWGMREWRGVLAGRASVCLGVLAAAACLGASSAQARYWKNSETLFRHATEVTPGNGIMASDLGWVLLHEGRAAEALPYLRQAAAFAPDLPSLHDDLAEADLATGRVAEALEEFQIHLKLAPKDAAAPFNIGAILLTNGLAELAIPYLQQARQLNPAAAECDYKLGNALTQTGRAREAIAAYDEALRLRPDYMEANANLAWILASHPDPSLRDGDRAVALASRADRLSGGRNPVSLGTLGVAYAGVGKFTEAIAAARRALQLLGAETNSPMAVALRAQIALYQSGQPFRDTAPARPAPPPPSQ